MRSKPDIDWSEIMVTHPTTAQQDNWRAVAEQFHCDGKAFELVDVEPGVGQSIFSPEEIAQFRNAALAAYEETLKAIQAFHAMADHRYLEGDTEISDEEIEF